MLKFFCILECFLSDESTYYYCYYYDYYILYTILCLCLSAFITIMTEINNEKDSLHVHDMVCT